MPNGSVETVWHAWKQLCSTHCGACTAQGMSWQHPCAMVGSLQSCSEAFYGFQGFEAFKGGKKVPNSSILAPWSAPWKAAARHFTVFRGLRLLRGGEMGAERQCRNPMEAALQHPLRSLHRSRYVLAAFGSILALWSARGLRLLRGGEKVPGCQTAVSKPYGSSFAAPIAEPAPLKVCLGSILAPWLAPCKAAAKHFTVFRGLRLLRVAKRCQTAASLRHGRLLGKLQRGILRFLGVWGF